MARVAGVDIPLEKRVEISLRSIFGIGPAFAKKILSAADVDVDKRAKNLTGEELIRIRDLIEKSYTVEGVLRHLVAANIKRQKDIGSYRGTRHYRNLPVHGQRTRTNARTKKGRRPVIGGTRKVQGVSV